MDSPTFLKRRFQIGSISGRCDFSLDERVFHPSEVAEKAREARKFVKSFLASNILTGSPDSSKPWNSSGVSSKNFRGLTKNSAGSSAAWDSPDQAFEQKFYNKIENQYILQQAKKKLEDSRRKDPEQKNWNFSTFLDAGNSSLPGKKEGKVKNYKNPTKKEEEFMEKQRAEKAARLAASARASSESGLWASWRRLEHWNDVPAQQPKLGERPNFAEIKNKIQAENGKDALTKFIKENAAQQENLQVREEKKETADPQPPQENLPAWQRSIQRARARDAMRSTAEFPIYRHIGEWSGSCRVWSCCGSGREDSRGCHNERREWNKTREIVGKSSRTTGFEWSITRNIEKTRPERRDPVKSLSVSASGQELAVFARVLEKAEALGQSGQDFPSSSDSQLFNFLDEGEALGDTKTFTEKFYQTAASRLGASGPGVAIVKRLKHPGILTTARVGRPAAERQETSEDSEDSSDDESCAVWSCCLQGRENPGCESQTVTRENRWNLE